MCIEFQIFSAFHFAPFFSSFSLSFSWVFEPSKLFAGLIFLRTCMAATRISSSLNSEFHEQRHSRRLIPSLTLFFLLLTAAVLGSPSMAASEPRRRLNERSSNNPPRKQRLESESGGRRRRDDRRFESAALEVLTGPKPILNNPPWKQRLKSESSGRRRRDDRQLESTLSKFPTERVMFRTICRENRGRTRNPAADGEETIVIRKIICGNRYPTWNPTDRGGEMVVDLNLRRTKFRVG